MNDFFVQYESILKVAYTSGIAAQPLILSSVHSRNLGRRELKRFYSGCHRGFEKAQNSIVAALAEIQSDHGVDAEEREYRELLLRKIMDGIATTILRDRIHLMRRMVIHDDAPNVEMKIAQVSLQEANRLNAESRMTFAIVADLTTFIHVADILRIDLRTDAPRVSLIELKSGKVNSMLLDKLEDYKPRPEELKRLRTDPTIEPRHAKQAERMLRQQIRRAQIEEISRTDIGADLKFGVPVIWSIEETELESYSTFLDELCKKALTSGRASGTVAKCLQLGVGFASSESEAKRIALQALNTAIIKSRAHALPELTAILSEIADTVPANERFTLANCFRSNLAATAVKPFVQWGLAKEHIHALAQRKLVVFAAFDIAAFIWLCRQVVGVEAKFGTRREAAEAAKDFGTNNTMTWGGRMLSIKAQDGWTALGGGILSRFVNDLTNPLAFMKGIARAKYPKSTEEVES